MIRIFFSVLLVLGSLVATAAHGSAQSKEDVEAFVGRALEHIRGSGQQQAFADFSRPDGGFVAGGLYMFCHDQNGIVWANGGNPKLVGRNLSGLRDAEGRLTVAEMYRVGQTKGGGWLEYLWPNPRVGRIQRKVSYVVGVDAEIVCGSGFFEPDQP